MDPVKEKLNMLKRLASEKRTQQISPPQAAEKEQSQQQVQTQNSTIEPVSSSSVPRPSSLIAQNKYINRIRSMYNNEAAAAVATERSASIETPPPLVQAAVNSDSLVTTAGDLDESLHTFSASLQPAVNKYVRQLRDTFSLAPSNRATSIENLKRASLNTTSEQQQQLNQINRIKEKFSRLKSNNNANSFFESSSLIGTGFRSADSRDREQYKSLRALDYSINPIKHILSPPPLMKTISPEITNSNATAITSNNKLHKYQNSRTSDLSDFILFDNHESFKNVTSINDDFNRLVDKYAVDLKYQPENGIIRSTMNRDNAYTNSFNSDTPPVRIKKNEKVSEANSSSAATAVASVIVAPVQYRHQITTQPLKRTKSILKTPSNFFERSIHFDDHINIIPIDKTEEEKEEEEKENYKPIIENSQVTTKPQPLNQQRLNEPYANRSRLIKAYSYFSSSSNLNAPSEKSIRPANSYRSSCSFNNNNNEIENIKKRFLEPKQPTSDRSSASPAVVTAAHRSRIFIKSPTPMRELNLPTHSANANATSNYLSVPSSFIDVQNPSSNNNNKSRSPMPDNRNNRQRFMNKKKAAAAELSESQQRSQSVDLSKLLENFNRPPKSISPPAQTSSPSTVLVASNLNIEFNRKQHQQPMKSMNSLTSRPGFTRQNAFRASSKSFGECLDKCGQASDNYVQDRSPHVHGRQNKDKRSNHHHHNHGHRHRYSHRHLHKNSKNHRHQRSLNKSSSLTSSSQSSHSSSEFESNSSLTNSESSYMSEFENENNNAAAAAVVAGGGYPSKQQPVTMTTNKNKLVRKSLYYSSDDSVCGIPKSNVKKKSSK